MHKMWCKTCCSLYTFKSTLHVWTQLGLDGLGPYMVTEKLPGCVYYLLSLWLYQLPNETLLFRCCFQSSKSVTKGGTKHSPSSEEQNLIGAVHPTKHFARWYIRDTTFTNLCKTLAVKWSCGFLHDRGSCMSRGVPQFLNKGVTTVKTSLGLHKMTWKRKSLARHQIYVYMQTNNQF